MKLFLFIYCIVIFSDMTAHATSTQTCMPDTIPASTSESQLIDNGDGTITDIRTSLIWKKCLEGANGVSCEIGLPSVFTWQAALEQPVIVNSNGGFAGYIDWRLPNIRELFSIVEEQCSFPAINLNRFPNANSSVWSGTPYDDNCARIVGFTSGDSGYAYRYSNNLMVRLVRGGNLDEGPLPCGGPQEEAGKDTSEIHFYNMGTNSGSFQFDYETYSIKDRIIIKHDNLQIFDTGCVGESKTVTINFSGSSPVISVEVIPNCAGSSGTKWTYTVHCPN